MVPIDQEFVDYAITPGVVERAVALEEMLYGDLAYEETYAKLLGWTIEGVRNYERLYGTDELLFEIEEVAYGLSDNDVLRIYGEVEKLRSRW